MADRGCPSSRTRGAIGGLAGTAGPGEPVVADAGTAPAGAPTAAEIDRWALQAGQLVIIDEASTAGTLELDQITSLGRGARARVLLVGDWAQPSPVSAGGAFKLLATDRDDAPELLGVGRFRYEWERDASPKLRSGRASAADEYARHGRVIGGDRDNRPRRPLCRVAGGCGRGVVSR